MFSFSRVVLASTVLFSPMATLALNTVEQAKQDATGLLRCWEPTEDGNYSLSKPFFELCSYMPAANNFESFHVNGVDMSSDNYENMIKMFEEQHPRHALVNLCLQEAYQLQKPAIPSQSLIRCICKRSGCNLPVPFLQFLDANKKVIEQ
ncbi:hypothetical protein L5515_019002 [Caenorhabditis briggsae]|uniref:Uncharacterized protein n=1 Tax=Caenorhabditis briggsae TaxID=6238 RepID=A0AAE9JTJ9_CAEBR|nr:hypothetical protein L5515_019002 [Caenorhabditis briggsae]